MGALFLFILVGIFSLISVVQSQCPHLEAGLMRWSNETTWGGSSFRVPKSGKTIVIDQPVLLDVSPPAIPSLLISATGKLVWDDEDDHELIVGSLKVEGEMHIGSHDCKFEHKATITLIGKSNDSLYVEDEEFGRKFIAVASGGVLELHGQDKLSWTKLDKSVDKLTVNSGLLYDHEYTVNSASRTIGLYVTVWNPNGTLYAFDAFRTTESKVFGRELDRYLTFMQGIPTGSIVGIAVRKSFARIPDVDYEPIYNAVEQLATLASGTSKLRNVGDSDAYALLAVKGANEYTLESVDVSDETKLSTDCGFIGRVVGDIKFSVRSVLGEDEHVDFTAVDEDAAFPKVVTIDDVTSWNAGDTVVFASTDYDMNQAEERTVYPCPDCANNEFRVHEPFDFLHFGQMTGGIDERGEVALLTRNIVIRGRTEDHCYGNNKCNIFDYDTFGGHLIIGEEYSTANIEGVEFDSMGQQSEDGRNPIHFYMSGPVDNRAFVKKNSIHHSFSRCVNIQGTFGLLVEDNVAYDILGHCYFLSDGAETGNVFDGNIGMNTKYSTLLPTERSCALHRQIEPKDGNNRPSGCGPTDGVSVFWISNPTNVVRNNVAAGSIKAGFWYPLFKEAAGPSKSRFYFSPMSTFHTPIFEFSNNVAHSSELGLVRDKTIKTTQPSIDKPQAYLGFLGDDKYEPWKDPDDPTSGRIKSVFKRLTAYKNWGQNALVVGGDVTLTFSSFGDSPVGVRFTMAGKGTREVTNSVFIGQSGNQGLPCSFTERVDGQSFQVTFNRSLPKCGKDTNMPFKGFLLSGGPHSINNNFFDGYKNEEWEYASTSNVIPAGAVGFLERNTDQPGNTLLSGLTFGFADKAGGNRVYKEAGVDEVGGEQLANVYDLDGTTSGYTDTQIVGNHPFLTSPRCYYHDNWGMSVCPYHYSTMKVNVEGEGKVMMVRDDAYESNFTLNGVAWNDFLLMNDKSYTMYFNDEVPDSLYLSFTFNFGHSGDFIRLGICYPKDVEGFQIGSRIPVESVEEVDADDSTYYWDNSTGLLFIKVVTNSQPDGDFFKCKQGTTQCPNIHIKRLGGSDEIADCYEDAYGPYIKDPDTEDPLEELLLDKVPRKATGSGPTRPFINRIIHITGERSTDSLYIVDGNWSGWTAWSECSNTCDGSRERSRECNNPSPHNGGLLCAGDAIEVEQCLGVVGCPVDGNWGPWTPWANCTVDCGGGIRNRSRACDNPPAVYGGRPCRGQAQETEICNVEPCPTTAALIDEVVIARYMNYTYLGCYLDNRVRDLQKMPVDDKETLTPALCVGHCVHYGYFFAAVQNGRYCFCGHHYGRYGKAPTEECNKLCPGDESSTCGGAYRNDLYYTGIELPHRKPCMGGRGVQLEDKCFVFLSTPKAWYEAEQDCIIGGGDLMTDLDHNQQAFIEYFTMEFGMGNYWMGLNDIQSEGSFEFTDDTQAHLGGWHNFAEGKPAGLKEDDDCIVMEVDDGYEWSDTNCGKEYMYICQVEVTGDDVCGHNNEGHSNYAECYLLLEGEWRWTEACSQCMIRRAVPATIASSLTQLFLKHEVAHTASDKDWYFGLNDVAKEGNYTFMDYTPRGHYNAYADGGPPGEDNNDCTMMVFEKNYFWQEVSCNSRGGVVCQVSHEKDNPCPIGWTEYLEQCYLYVDQPATYAEATAYCDVAEGTLVTIDNGITNAFFLNEFAVKEGTHIWIGLDAVDKDTFKWQDTQCHSEYSNWGRNEPNAEEGNDCTVLLKTTGQWKASSCESSNRYVCAIYMDKGHGDE